MPVRNGRWVNPQVIYEEEKAAKAAKAEAATTPPEAAVSEQKATKTRRSRKAAEAAIADATGANVTLDAPAPTNDGDEADQEDS